MRTLALVLLISCTPEQAPPVHRAGEVAILVGLGGMVVSGIAAAVSRNGTVAHLDYGFVPLTFGGAAAYWISDKPNEQFEEQEAQRKFDEAFALARQAKHAARGNDCAQVQAIEPKVRALDESVYRRFRHEPIIAACLAPAGSAQ